MSLEEFLLEWRSDSPYVEVKTSGSTGEPKRMMVEKRRMMNSARITCDFLGLKPGDTALLCMSLDYIAGKMMVVRSIERNLKLITVEPSGHPLTEDSKYDLVAMVPMQVYNSLQMTETLSHIALRRLNGKEASEWYEPFPSVKVRLNEEGCLVIDAPEVCEETLVTNDIAEIEASGRRFRILGRKDNVICSGGIKIQTEEVERTLKPYLDAPYMISKRPDPKFGEIVVLLTEGDISDAREACERILPKYQQPKDYLRVDRIPLTETGKPARKEAEKLAL